MAILKSPPRPPKNETVQIRVEEEIRAKLQKYAEFIDSSESYVVSEALKLLFRKDDEFRAWLEEHARNGDQAHAGRGSLFEMAKKASACIASGSSRGRIFTFLHEAVHVMLNQSGLCDIGDDRRGNSPTSRVEMFCNRVAGATLFP